MSTPTIEQIEHLEPVDRPTAVIVCPKCRGTKRVFSSESWKNETGGKYRRYTKRCDCGTGFIHDPRIAIYYGSDPAAFVASCCERPRDDERLRVWAKWCNDLWKVRTTHLIFDPNEDPAYSTIDYWIRYFGNKSEQRVKHLEAAAILRSLFAPPWLCGVVQCMRCGYPETRDCPHCHGTGSVLTPPEFDPRWRTCDVLEVAQGILKRVNYRCTSYGKSDEAGTYVGFRIDTDFDRMPILADALMDAGCDSEAMLTHLHSPGGPWVKEDWVLSLILGGV